MKNHKDLYKTLKKFYEMMELVKKYTPDIKIKEEHYRWNWRPPTPSFIPFYSSPN